jgi:hypothetical protein
MTMTNKPIVIGVGGFARSGKDTFVKIAKKILKENGYTSIKVAFADAVKEDMDTFLKENYNISAWTDDTEDKNIIRPFLVAHGCGKRLQTDGKYWIDKVNEEIERIHCEDVVFVSDCRFPNEVDWIHEKLGGWFVHVKKYSIRNNALELNALGVDVSKSEFVKYFDKAPNEEEAKNDPLCEQKADYKLEMENAIEREQRLKGIKITVDSLVDNSYLNNEIKLCLLKCPFLTLR